MFDELKLICMESFQTKVWANEMLIKKFLKTINKQKISICHNFVLIHQSSREDKETTREVDFYEKKTR